MRTYGFSFFMANKDINTLSMRVGGYFFNYLHKFTFHMQLFYFAFDLDHFCSCQCKVNISKHCNSDGVEIAVITNDSSKCSTKEV